jgi:hypothetical protein
MNGNKYSRTSGIPPLDPPPSVSHSVRAPLFPSAASIATTCLMVVNKFNELLDLPSENRRGRRDIFFDSPCNSYQPLRFYPGVEFNAEGEHHSPDVIWLPTQLFGSSIPCTTMTTFLTMPIWPLSKKYQLRSCIFDGPENKTGSVQFTHTRSPQEYKAD